jgi:hypothetical protein
MEQSAKEEIIGETAVAAVAHSEGKGAPVQVLEVGAMERRREVGSCCRVWREVGCARVVLRRRRVVRVVSMVAVVSEDLDFRWFDLG